MTAHIAVQPCVQPCELLYLILAICILIFIAILHTGTVVADMQRRPASALLSFSTNLRGVPGMDISMLVGQKSQASLHEFSGPNGTGTEIPPVGAVQFTSSDANVATVDTTTGDVVAVAPGTATISGVDHGNGFSGSGLVTVTLPPPPPGAQSAELRFTDPV